jgi:hypothetical protein
MSLLLLLNPKHYGQESIDTSDILVRKVRAYRKREEREEEAIAASLLAKRLKKSELPENVNPSKLASELVKPLQKNPNTALSPEKLKRLKMILILMIADLL